MTNKFHSPHFDTLEDNALAEVVPKTEALFDNETINRLYRSYMRTKDINDLDALEKRMGISMEDKRKIVEDILAEISNDQLSNVQRLELQKKYFGQKNK